MQQIPEDPESLTNHSFTTERMMAKKAEPDTFRPPCHKLRKDIKTKLVELLKKYQSQFTHNYHWNHTTDWWVSRWSSTHLDPIFSYRDLHYGYRITDTCRTRDVLLLLFLVPTCHLSMVPFFIRFFMTNYCEWWCRGSTHLQKQWQGWTACYKT